MSSSFLSTTVGVRNAPRRTCFISLPQCLVSSVVPSSVHVFSITDKSSHECLVSWAGESHVTEGFNVPVVILSNKILSMNGFSLEESECVILKQVPTPSPCERVCISVSTACDWENLILNSDVVQLEFLEQLRLVFPGLKFPLWLEGGACVEMTVLRITPAAVCGLLLPLTYVEIVPPDDGATSTEENRKSSSLKLGSAGNSTCCQATNPVYEASASSKNGVQSSSLMLLTKSVLSNLCLLNQSIVDTPSPRIVKLLRVLPTPTYPLMNTQSHPLTSVVIVSKEAVIGTQFYKHSFFPAKIQISYPTPSVTDVRKTTPKKPVAKVENRTLCAMIMVLENARQSLGDSYNLDSIFSSNVMGHFALVPDSMRRVLSLPVPCLIKLETGNLRLRSDPLIIDVQPLERLRDSEREIVSTNLKLFLKSCCDLCDTLVNDRSIYTVMVQKRFVSVLLLLHGDHPLILTRVTVELLDIRVSASPSSEELLLIPRSPPSLESDNDFLTGSHSFVGDATVLKNLKKSLVRQLGITPCRLTEPKFTLLQGEAASGRTTLIQTVCRDLSALPCRVHCRIVTLKEYIGKTAEAVEKRLLDAAHRASQLRPSLLVLDDLDVLCRARSSDETFGPLANHHYQLICALQKMLHFVSSSNVALKFQNDGQIGNVVVLGICVDRSSLDQRLASLDRSDLFPITLTLSPPSPTSRVQAFKKILAERFCSLEKFHFAVETSVHHADDQLPHLSENKLLKITEGYKLPDLVNLSVRISVAVEDKLKNRMYEPPMIQHWSEWKLRVVEHAMKNGDGLSQPPGLLQLVSDDDVIAAASEYVPLAYKDIPLRNKSDSSSLALGGLHEARRLLQECLYWPSVYPQLFTQCPAAMVTGLLLYGPPGCGKTRLAHHVAMQANVNFITVKGPELLSKYIGQSEENVRDTFSRAASRTPCLLFFDEFDALAPRRGHDSTGVTDRVVNQLLTQLDGTEGRKGVWVMAATCRPDLIDPALLRPGRLEKCIYCPLPSEGERAEILSVLSSSLELTSAMDWDNIAALTPGFSGADLQSVLTTAHIAAVRELMSDVLYKGVMVEDEGPGVVEDMRKLRHERTTHVEVSSTAKSIQRNLEDYGRLQGVKVESGVEGKAERDHRNEDLVMNQNSLVNNSGDGNISPEKTLSGVQQVVLRNANLTPPQRSAVPQTDQKLRLPTPKGDNASKKKVLVSLSHLLSAVKEVKPSVSASERQKYEALHESFSRSSKSSACKERSVLYQSAGWKSSAKILENLNLNGASLLLLLRDVHCKFKLLQVALVLNKIDRPLPRDTKEVLSVLRLSDLKQYCRQPIAVFEVSAWSGKGLKALTRWVWGDPKPAEKS
ncbi:ATPase AAA-type core [Trinorchestia longiramus]|nr:ATPase AAA-type core [Trinorchestia longiramus]